MTTYEEWLTGRGFSSTTIQARSVLYRARDAAWHGDFDQPAHVIAAWLASYSGWTRVTYYSHLGSIYRYLLEVGELEDNPMASIKRGPSPRPRPRPLSEAQLSRALAAATPRTRSFLMLGYLAGLRAHEIAKFRGSDLTAHTLRVVGKGGYDDFLPTHPLLWDLAEHYPRDGYWFPPQARKVNLHIQSGTVTYYVGQLFRSLDIKGATHRARHSYGTELLRGGANLRVVQELLRHRSLATTALYLGTDEDERSAAVMSLKAPAFAPGGSIAA